MPPIKHATLSPSSAHRWLICTPSAMLESREPAENSEYAQEGTEAHELAEIKLSYALGHINSDLYEAKFNEFKNSSKYYNKEFNDYVNDYVEKVMQIVENSENVIQVKLESRVHFEDIVPGGSGTSDVLIICKDYVHVIDLKFGKGVPVSAVDNSQLKLYALGAIRESIRVCNCKFVNMTIIQPRLNDVSSFSMPIEELNKWALEYVKPRAELAIAGLGSLVPGEHCKFCRMRNKCETLAKRQLEIAKAEFSETIVDDRPLSPCELKPELIANILSVAPRFIDWFNEIKEYASKKAISGELEIPGYKVVEGKSNRTIIDQEAVIERLMSAGFQESDYMTQPKLLGITNLEKNIGKKMFNSLCGEYVVKPPGALTLVPESDKRERIEIKRLDGSEFME